MKGTEHYDVWDVYNLLLHHLHHHEQLLHFFPFFNFSFSNNKLEIKGVCPYVIFFIIIWDNFLSVNGIFH